MVGLGRALKKEVWGLGQGCAKLHFTHGTRGPKYGQVPISAHGLTYISKIVRV